MPVDRELANRFSELGPWATKFTIHGEPYGGQYDASADDRLAQFHRCFPDVSTILELGSFEGGHTAALARMPGVERVIGIEGRIENVRRAEFVLDVMGIENASVRHANIENLSPRSLERVDVVFNCGVLYHLSHPWELLRVVSRVSRRMFLSTHYCETTAADVWQRGYPGYRYHEYGYEDRLSGLRAESFWPTRQALFDMLAVAGFAITSITFDEPRHAHGPLIALACEHRRTHWPDLRRHRRRLGDRIKAMRDRP